MYNTQIRFKQRSAQTAGGCCCVQLKLLECMVMTHGAREEGEREDGKLFLICLLSSGRCEAREYILLALGSHAAYGKCGPNCEKCCAQPSTGVRCK